MVGVPAGATLHRSRPGISVDEAIATRGALLFKFPGVTDVMALKSRPEGAHVALSLGDGRTMEASGRNRPVGIFKAHNREWTHGGLASPASTTPTAGRRRRRSVEDRRTGG